MAEVFTVGPMRLLTAAAIEDPVEDWTDLGSSRGDVRVNLEGGHYSFGRADQIGRAPTADGVFFIGHDTRVRYPMLQHDIEVLVDAVPRSVVITAGAKKALGFGSKFATVTPKAFALVPEGDYVAGSPWWGNNDVTWLPKATLHVLGEWRYALPEGEDALAGTVFEVEIRAVSDDSYDERVRLGGIGCIDLFGVGAVGLDFLWDPENGDGLTATVGGTGTFSRSGTAATYWDENGVLQTTIADELRNSHYPTIGGPRTCLLEGQRTNLVPTQDLSTWDVTGTPVVTGGQADPAGGTSAYKVQDDDGAATEQLRKVVSITGDGVKAVSVVIKQDVMPASGTQNIRLRDEVALVDRMDASITGWVGGEPQVTMVAGVLLRKVKRSGGFWELWLQSTACTAANSHQVRFLLAGTASETGSLIIYHAQVEDAPVPSSVIRTSGSTVTRSRDDIQFPLPGAIDPAQETTFFADFVEMGMAKIAFTGSVIGVAVPASVLNTPRFWINSNGTNYRARYESGVDASESSLAAPAIGDGVTHRAVLGSGGSMLLAQSINDGAESGGPTGAATLAAWASGAKVQVGALGTATSPVAIKRIAIARRTRTRAEMLAA